MKNIADRLRILHASSNTDVISYLSIWIESKLVCMDSSCSNCTIKIASLMYNLSLTNGCLDLACAKENDLNTNVTLMFISA